MFKSKRVKDAEFWRVSTVSGIDVYLLDGKGPIPLSSTLIIHFAKALSERELEETIEILSSKAKVMIKQRNFPLIYAEMLSDLIEVQMKRYGKRVKKEKKRKLGYSVSIDKLEEILGEYYKIKDVHAYSIDVGSDRSNAERIDVDSDYRYLILSFRGGK